MFHKRESLHYFLICNVQTSERIMLLHSYCRINNLLLWRWEYHFPGVWPGPTLSCPKLWNKLMTSETSYLLSSSRQLSTFPAFDSFLVPLKLSLITHHQSFITGLSLAMSGIQLGWCSTGKNSGSCQTEVGQVDHP